MASAFYDDTAERLARPNRRWYGVVRMTPTTHPSAAGPIRLAFWYGKGGVGKSTATLLLSMLAARSGQRVLVVDLDPECGTSRDFLGAALPQLDQHLKSFLASPLLAPPPVLPTGIDNLDLVPCPPDEQRFFRLFPEHSVKLRDALDLLPPDYAWTLMDVPNQFDNVAHLGLIAATHVILPVELTADCRERVDTALRVVQEARALNPGLVILGGLALASTPRAGQDQRLSAKERLIYREYQDALGRADIQMFETIMFRSATTVEEARSNADVGLLHWTARRRFQQLLAEIYSRIKKRALAHSPSRHARQHSREQGRTAAPANA